MARTAREVLNELRWRGDTRLEEVTLHVRDRMVPGNHRAISGRDVTALGRKTFDVVTATIPYYKIVRIEHRGRVVFERTD